MTSQVAVVLCKSYDPEAVETAVEKGINLLGGIDKFLSAGEKILLKPNMLVGTSPDKGVTTHPSVFRAAAKLCSGTGAVVSYGDSPAPGNTKSAVKACGYTAAADEFDIQLGDFKNGKEVVYDKGSQNKKFFIADAVLESDGVISLCKLKTHGLEKMTGAVKNQFGCVPGMLKGEYHLKLPDPFSFARMLVDLNSLVNPRLYIMDAIDAMEGNGPRNGQLRRMNLLLFSPDPIALDAVMCRLVDLNPDLLPTNTIGEETGAGSYHDIEIIGENIKDHVCKDFKVDRSVIRIEGESSALGFLKKLLLSKPVIDDEKCIKCGICVKMCPVENKAVDWFNGDKETAPQYDYNKCIRCFCCQELCPEGAVFIRKPFLRRIFS